MNRYYGVTFADLIRSGEIHYGDPPNMESCPAGPTMNSEPRRVLQYWIREQEDVFGWRRCVELEIEVPS